MNKNKTMTDIFKLKETSKEKRKKTGKIVISGEIVIAEDQTGLKEPEKSETNNQSAVHMVLEEAIINLNRKVNEFTGNEYSDAAREHLAELIRETGELVKEYERVNVDQYLQILDNVEKNINEYQKCIDKEKKYYKQLIKFLNQIGCEMMEFSVNAPFDEETMDAENIYDFEPEDYSSLVVTKILERGYCFRHADGSLSIKRRSVVEVALSRKNIKDNEENV